jgi:hypothetical protein
MSRQYNVGHPAQSVETWIPDVPERSRARFAASQTTHPRLRTPTLYRRQLQYTDDRSIHGERARPCSVSAVSIANSLPPAHHVRASATRFDPEA